MLDFKKISIGLVGLLVVSIIGLGFLYKQLSIVKNPDATAKAEVAKIIGAVGRLMVLPTDEVPSVATVTDPAKLKDQPFFQNAKTGDKVLVYTNARKAILYSPLLNKIIEVAPINSTALNGSTSATVTPPTPTPPPPVPKKK